MEGEKERERGGRSYKVERQKERKKRREERERERRKRDKEREERIERVCACERGEGKLFFLLMFCILFICK